MMMAKNGGNIERVIKGISLITVFVVLSGAFLVLSAYSTEALSIDELRARIEERRAQREAEREQRRQERERSNQENIQPVCDCSASLSLGQPSIMWKGDTLTFIPTVNVSIRTRGNVDAPEWQLNLDYDGMAHTTSFSGSKSWGGQCFDGRYTYNGVQLPSVTVGGLLRSMFGADDEFTSVITMKATLSQCDSGEVNRQAKFSIFEFGNLSIGSWRRVR